MEINLLAALDAAILTRWLQVRGSFRGRIRAHRREYSQDTEPWDSPEFGLISSRKGNVSPHSRGFLKLPDR